MRNVKVYSNVGVTIEAGMVRLRPLSVTVIQEDQLTPQFMKEYGDQIAVASMDDLAEKIGAGINAMYLVRNFGWTVKGVKEVVPPIAKPLPPPPEDVLWPKESATDRAMNELGREEKAPREPVEASTVSEALDRVNLASQGRPEASDANQDRKSKRKK